jgi:hypothetical protein
VLLFRLVTFWLPVPVGWVALNYLERKHAILAGQVPALWRVANWWTAGSVSRRGPTVHRSVRFLPSCV